MPIHDTFKPQIGHAAALVNYQKRISEYNKNPKMCKQCNQALPYKEHTRKTFCSRSCSATYNNKGECRNGEPRGSCMNCNSPLNNCNSKKYCCSDCRKEHSWKLFVTQWKNGQIHVKELTGRYRTYLMNEANNQCSQCGWSEVNQTTGKIPLTIDHIDGNPYNHILSNLRVLCPNCHSLTPNYGALNTGKGRKNRHNKPQRIVNPMGDGDCFENR